MGRTFHAMVCIRSLPLTALLLVGASLLPVARPEEDHDETAYIDMLVKEASAAYLTAADAAKKQLEKAEMDAPSPEEKMYECVCDKRAATGDHCGKEEDPEKESETKMRAEFDSACKLELKMMPPLMKDEIMEQCVKRKVMSAGFEWKDPAETRALLEARKMIEEECKFKLDQEAPTEKKEIVIEANPQALLRSCICEKAECKTEEERDLLDEQVEKAAKKCKKKVAIEFAEAMGEGEDDEIEMDREAMAAKMQECVCDARADLGDPCMS